MQTGIRGIPTMIGYQAGREGSRQSGAGPARAIEEFVRSKARVGG